MARISQADPQRNCGKISAAGVSQPFFVFIERQERRLITNKTVCMLFQDVAAFQMFQLLYRVCRYFYFLRQPTPERHIFDCHFHL